jgi:Tol biopolymer transport system component/predicted Ser/Thr protein kinase
MSIEPGTRLGPYEITSPLGAGGMGDVYKAKDTRLDRTVAIKVLPEHLSTDPARRERFEREARAVSSLNHPHICTLYEFDTQDGVDFIVMEYLEGETLADRLRRGPLELERAIEYGIQIAGALDKAHRQGIVHRDLKPGNIMLTKAGVKLLDFGLARLHQGFGEASPDESAPTEAKPLTEEGAILGTLQYMSPEQLEAKEADARSDIFAFGAVLYEMITGKKAFEGSSQASLITAIMSAEPLAVSERQSMSPPGLDRVVKKCLAKDSEERWHSAHDLADELKWVVTDALETHTPAGRRAVLPWVVAAAALATGFGLWAMSWSTTPPATPVRLAVTIPPTQRLTLEDTIAISLALSPDGQRLAYVAREDGIARIYLRRLDSFEAERVPGTERAGRPFFSPDGSYLGFHRDRQLQKVSLSGGTPMKICDVPEVWSWPTWGADDTIVFSPGTRSGLSRVNADGGSPETLTTPDRKRGEQDHRWPQFLPDGNRLLFTILTDFGDARLAVLSLDTGEWDYIDGLNDASTARYVASDTPGEPGHLFFLSAGDFTTQRFDVSRLEPVGAPVAFADVFSLRTAAHYAVSDKGSLAYVPGTPIERHPVTVNRGGQQEGEPFDVVTSHPTLSPDGGRLAVHWNEDIWILDLARGTRLRITTEGGRTNPIWSPDGTSVVYRHTAATHDLIRKRADGSGDEEVLHSNEYGLFITSWSPDGKTIAFEEENPETGRDLMLLPLEDGATPEPYVRTPFIESGLRFSPDGNLVAYVSDETGSAQVYVRRYPGDSAPLPISSAGGAEPVWSPKGNEVFYRNGDQMLAVTVSADPRLEAEAPRSLFEATFFGTQDHAHYDVFPDGEHFIMLTTLTENTLPSQINVVLNGAEELEGSSLGN